MASAGYVFYVSGFLSIIDLRACFVEGAELVTRIRLHRYCSDLSLYEPHRPWLPLVALPPKLHMAMQ
jgi:hypothetical protein